MFLPAVITRSAAILSAVATASLCGVPFGNSVAATRSTPVTFHPTVEGLTEVRSLDVAADADRLHALLVGRFDQRDRVAVAYSFSADDGRTWSRPSFIDPEVGSPPISRRGNDAQLAVRGRHLLAVWQSPGDTPVSGPLAVAISNDGGKTWAAGANPAVGDATHNQSHPAVAVDPAGTFHLAWLDDREESGDTQGLRYAKSRNGGIAWQPETTLDPTACTCCWNRLAVLPDQSIGVLYRNDDPHDMRLARWSENLRRWQDAGVVGPFGWKFTGCPHCGGGLAGTGSARGMTLHGVVWTGKEGIAGLYYLRSGDGGTHWSAPLRIGNRQSRESDIAALPEGELGLAFISNQAEGTTVYFQKSSDSGGHWSAPFPLAASRRGADHPRVVATPMGFRVFWTESRESGGKTWTMAAL